MKKLVVFSVIVVTVGAVVGKLWQVEWYPMHDTTHLARVLLMKETIQAGQLPPIWADRANEGYGYPLFHFYAPLFYYVSLLIKAVTNLPYTTSLKLALSGFSLVGGLGMYCLGKRWGKVGGLLASVAFLTLPYHAVNLYVRGAFAEYAATMLLPWLFWAWQRTQKGKQQYWTAVITSAFMLSHNLVPLVVFPILIGWILYHHFHRWRDLLLPVGLSLSLGAYFILPLLLERSFVQVDKIAKTTDFRLHFVQPWQLWNSSWGYGGSAPGVEDGMSFKLGKLQLVLGIIGLTYLAKTKKKGLLGLMLAAMLLAFLMTTEWSEPIWQLISYLGMIQFPWRYLTLLGFLLSWMAGLALGWLPRWSRLGMGIILGGALLFFNLKYFQPQSNLVSAEEQLLSEDYIKHTLARVIPEYLPTWMPDFPAQPAAAFVKNDDLQYELDSRTNYYQLSLELEREQKVVINKAYYPTWEGRLDGGRKVQLQPNAEGLIQVTVPQGGHTLELEQTHTALEKVSFYLSLMTLGYMLHQLLVKQRGKG